MYKFNLYMEDSLKEKILALFDLNEKPDIELAYFKFNPMYIITNYGDVVSLYRNGIAIIKSDLNNGYIRYKMQIGSKKNSFFGHRLVAMHFILTDGDIDNLVVNHIDGSRINNYYKNLEWCTTSENSNHAYWVRRGKVDIESYDVYYKNKLNGLKHKNKSDKEKTEPFKIKNTGLPMKTSVEAKLLSQFNHAVNKGLHLPMDAHSIEVFAIKDSEDSPTGKQAFIGYKLANGDFHYIQVPFTEPKK